MSAWCVTVVISIFAVLAAQLVNGEFNWMVSIGAGVGLGVVTAAVLGAGTATIRWGLVYVVLLSAGVVPVRATAFIEDAHRRGVLRVVGMEYQFRHAKIQAHLASV